MKFDWRAASVMLLLSTAALIGIVAIAMLIGGCICEALGAAIVVCIECAAAAGIVAEDKDAGKPDQKTREARTYAGSDGEKVCLFAQTDPRH